MLELVTIQIGNFVKNINEKKKRNSLFRKIDHQNFRLI